MRLNNIKFRNSLQKIYRANGFSVRYGSVNEMLKDNKWMNIHKKGGNISHGYGKRIDEKRLRLVEKRIRKKDMNDEINQN